MFSYYLFTSIHHSCSIAIFQLWFVLLNVNMHQSVKETREIKSQIHYTSFFTLNAESDTSISIFLSFANCNVAKKSLPTSYFGMWIEG